MMRNTISLPFSKEQSLIIASDNSGAIGMKENDLIQVSYEIVAYYSFRVAVMECIAAGGQPLAVVIQNFCGNEPWDELVKGIRKGLQELNLHDIPIKGSTESNFSLLQSAVGMMVIGKKGIDQKKELEFTCQLKFAIIGLPLVGNEVVALQQHIAPLSSFRDFCHVKEVIVWPVGSKGILHEMNQMFPNKTFTKDMILTDIDVLKSSGPATCYIVVYEVSQEELLKEVAKENFHPIDVRT